MKSKTRGVCVLLKGHIHLAINMVMKQQINQLVKRFALVALAVVSALAVSAQYIDEDIQRIGSSKNALLKGFRPSDYKRLDCNYDGQLTNEYTMTSKCEIYDDSLDPHYGGYVECQVTEIAEDAFKGQDLVKTIKLSDCLTAIPEDVFRDCKSLESVSINPENKRIKADWESVCEVTGTGKTLIWVGCKVSQFTIPEDVSHISRYAFQNCIALTDLTIAPANPYFELRGGVIYEKGLARVVACLPTVAEVTILPGVECIPDGFMESAAYAGVTKVVLPEGLLEIGERSFSGCSSLSEITIPSSVKTISKCAFSNAGLVRICFSGDFLTSIGQEAFSDMPRLADIELPKNVGQIGTGLFKGCLKLTSAKLPDNVTVLPDDTFKGCIELQSYVVPDNIISLGEGVFSGSGISEVSMHDAVKSVGERAFENTAKLQGVRLSASLSQIPKRMFRGSGISAVSLPQGVTEICDSAFVDCQRLQTIELPNSLERISDASFRGSSLKMIHIPASVREIGKFAFANTVDEVTGCEGLVTIDENAFDGCQFKSFPFGERLEAIQRSAFNNCSELEEANLPENCQLSGCVFANAKSLKAFRVPWVNKTVYAGLLRNSGVETVIIPGNCKRIYAEAFYTPTLMTVYCNAVVPEMKSDDNVFHDDTYCLGYLRVPVGSKDQFANTAWGLFRNIVEDATGVEEVGNDTDLQVSVIGGELTVSGVSGSVEVYAADGHRVYAGLPGNISTLPAGIYIVRCGSSVAKVRI